MTGQTTSPPDPPGGQSFTAAPTDRARTYQTGRDQTINEHHHYAPRGSLKTGMAWSLAGAAILALGAFVGVDLWEKQHGAAGASPAGDAKAPDSLPSAPPSTSPEPSGTVSPSALPSGEQSQPESAAPASHPTPSASTSGPPPNPATSCTGWKESGVSRVQVKACGRIANDRLYMSAEWRTTSGSALVDVYIWLEDATGSEVVYPGTSMRHGMPSYNMAAWPTPQTKEQWKEYPVGEPLQHGELYQVSVSVMEKGGAKPNINNPAVKGHQLGIVYT